MDIYEVLFSKPVVSHIHLDRYHKFILNCCEHNKNNILESSELHHICPKAKDLFPEYIDLKKHIWNGINLSPRQHYIAHYFLHKAYGGSQTFAFIAMCHQIYKPESRSNVNRKHKINSRLYEAAKLELSKIERNKGMVVCKHLITGEKMSVSKEEFKNNLNLVGVNYGLVTCYDSEGNRLTLTKEDFLQRTDLIVPSKGRKFDFSHKKGMVNCRDKTTGEYALVTTEEYHSNKERYLHHNTGKKIKKKTGYKMPNLSNYKKGKVICRNAITGEVTLVSKLTFDQDDNLVGLTSGNESVKEKISKKSKGMVVCKDRHGNRFKITKIEFDRRKGIDVWGNTAKIPDQHNP